MPDITNRSDRREVRVNDGVLAVTRRSMFSGKRHTLYLPITAEQEALWKSGTTYIQTALPNLTADQREFLLTGAAPGEWDNAFPEDEEENILVQNAS